MNAKDLWRYANDADIYRITEYRVSKVGREISKNAQSRQFVRQKGFLVCEACFWCASLYLNEDKIKVSSSLQCPNCYNKRVELLPIF